MIEAIESSKNFINEIRQKENCDDFTIEEVLYNVVMTDKNLNDKIEWSDNDEATLKQKIESTLVSNAFNPIDKWSLVWRGAGNFNFEMLNKLNILEQDIVNEMNDLNGQI